MELPSPYTSLAIRGQRAWLPFPGNTWHLHCRHLQKSSFNSLPIATRTTATPPPRGARLPHPSAGASQKHDARGHGPPFQTGTFLQCMLMQSHSHQGRRNWQINRTDQEDHKTVTGFWQRQTLNLCPEYRKNSQNSVTSEHEGSQSTEWKDNQWSRKTICTSSLWWGVNVQNTWKIPITQQLGNNPIKKWTKTWTDAKFYVKCSLPQLQESTQ